MVKSKNHKTTNIPAISMVSTFENQLIPKTLHSTVLAKLQMYSCDGKVRYFVITELERLNQGLDRRK